MFRCQICDELQPSHQPVNTVVTKKRERVYVINEYGDETHGWEIVEEMKCCPPCFVLNTGKTPKLVEKLTPLPKKQNREHPRFHKIRPAKKTPKVEVVNNLPLIRR